MKITVYFKPNSSEESVRLIVNHPFMRSRSKSVSIRMTYSDNKPSIFNKIVEMVEIFIPERLFVEVPKFFIGELKMLSPQIINVERA